MKGTELLEQIRVLEYPITLTIMPSMDEFFLIRATCDCGWFSNFNDIVTLKRIVEVISWHDHKMPEVQGANR
jgi:hypothetical protein